VHFQFLNSPFDSNQKTIVTCFRGHADGSILCGSLFNKKKLIKLIPSPNATKIESIFDYKIDDFLGSANFGVLGGLKSSETGDSICSILLPGSFPGFLKGIFKKKFPELDSCQAVNKFLQDNTNCGGSWLRSLVVQFNNKENNMETRSPKDPGALWDVYNNGGFIYGLNGKVLWKEPYMKPDKRETLRTDLGQNTTINRDFDGYQWFISKDNRLLRLGGIDIKPVMTNVKLPKTGDTSSILFSTTNGKDGFLYCILADQKTLIRLRRNPESHVNEFQIVYKFNENVTSLLTYNSEKFSRLLVATEGKTDANVWSMPLTKFEDVEILEEPGKLTQIGTLEGLACLGHLTVDDKNRVWGCESSIWSTGKIISSPRLVRISGIA